MMTIQGQNVRMRLIETGLDELNRHGIHDFSVRRIAAACGVSCAAPYKHFANRDDYIAAVMEHAKLRWRARQQAIMAQYAGSSRQQLLAICRDYISFLVENPYFRSVLMSKDSSFDAKYQKLKSGISDATRELVMQYCREVEMPEAVARIKLFVVRSIIYGAAMMIDNGEVPGTPEFMDEIIGVIDREFNLTWEK